MNTSMGSGTQMTFAEFGQEICRKPSVTVSDFHVRLSALLETDEALKIHEELYSLRSCDLLKSDTLKFYSQKMLEDCSTIVGGGTFQTLILAMADVGYSVEWQVLNSRYFGVPQNRERVFLVGHLGEECTEKVFPLATDYPKADELQGQGTVVSNTIAGAKRDSVGIYPCVDSGGGYCGDTENQRLSQGIILQNGKKPKLTDTSKTLDTRVGALPNFAEQYVLEE